MRSQKRKQDDSWQNAMAWNIRALWVLILAFAIMAIISSCSHKTLETAVRQDSVSISMRTDTVYKERVRTEKVKEFIDRWNDRLVVVTPLGDTVKDYRTNTIYIEKDTHLRDSIDHYRAKCDSLRSAAHSKEKEYVEVRKSSSWRDTIQLIAMGAVIGMAGTLYIKRKS